MVLKELFLASLLLLPFSAVPIGLTAYGAEPTYQVTETELTELEMIFKTLKTRQQEQQVLLTKQDEQIKTLKIQLTESETQIKNSKIQLAEVQTKLNAANKSLAEYAEGVKRDRQRLKRQRDTWTMVTAVALGYAIARR